MLKVFVPFLGLHSDNEHFNVGHDAANEFVIVKLSPSSPRLPTSFVLFLLAHLKNAFTGNQGICGNPDFGTQQVVYFGPTTHHAVSVCLHLGWHKQHEDAQTFNPK